MVSGKNIFESLISFLYVSLTSFSFGITGISRFYETSWRFFDTHESCGYDRAIYVNFCLMTLIVYFS